LGVAPGPFLENTAVQKFVRFIVAGLIILVLLAFMCTYTVRFTERAVLTTFGKAGADDVVVEPGLKFKWPPPVQSVTKYESRVRLLTLKVETQQTGDNRQVAVETFCTWRVSDPLLFFQTFATRGERAEEHYRKAEDALRANLRAAAGVVSQYTMEDLFTTTAGASKLPELEAKMLGVFRDARQSPSGGQQQVRRLADYGIEAVDVGLTRILLPEEVTKAVFDRMKSSRDRLAKEIESQGQSRAQSIRERAQADATRIRSFAESLAAETRRAGDVEASEYFEQMSENAELAVFMEKIRFLEDIRPRTATLVFSTQMPGLDLLSPGAVQGLRPGQFPGTSWLSDSMNSGARRGEGVQPNGAADVRDAQGGRR
jgi:membrane protease subunit HflC